MKNKRNLNTKWLLLQNDQNADTTLLHSHDDMSWLIPAHIHVPPPSHHQPTPTPHLKLFTAQPKVINISLDPDPTHM